MTKTVALFGLALTARLVPLGVSAAILLLPVLLVLTWLVPARSPEDVSALASRPGWRWARRVGMTLLPGAYDIRQGQVWRGYVFLTLAVFVFYLAMAQRFLGLLAGVPGLISAVAWPGMTNRFPLPPMPEVGMWQAYSSARFFWEFPYARVFWPFVVLCALTVFVYHATRLWRIWQS